ncbi:hypothetical protein DUI87_05057 [Hirundo rustica rustica]|uniref:Peptidase A2 domain-containing protein n=1 Tax=Hirundo rustica rustica TaxID=333673 RepID=A0A3M0KZG1_HIRRU|nr:hypothetical protein DUI87_05057 [Hirundo rustica rustica]
MTHCLTPYEATHISHHDLSKPTLTTNSVYKPYRLWLSEGLHVCNGDWTFILVNQEERGTWPRIQGEFIIIGDCKDTPQEIEVLPGTLVNNPRGLVLWLCCTHPPTYLPKGQIIAQVILAWGPTDKKNIPTACLVQAITEERPQVACEFSVGGEALHITGLLDTGANVTIVPMQYWLSHWALKDVAGHVQATEKAIIHHYMDDVFVCAPNDDVLSHTLDLTIDALVAAGLELQEDKWKIPWKYLGLEIGRRTIVLQKLDIRIWTLFLRRFHQLLKLCLLTSLIAPTSGWFMPQPKANVWATLVRAMGQDHIWLLATSADKPLTTCLVGIPYRPEEFPLKRLEMRAQVNCEGISKGQTMSWNLPPESFVEVRLKSISTVNSFANLTVDMTQ